MSKLVNREQLHQLISAHFKEVIREPAVLFWGIVFPILMSLGLGIAFTQKSDVVHNVAVIADSVSGGTSSPLAGFFEHKCRKIQTAQTVPCFEYVITNQRLGNTQFHFYLTDRDEALVRLKRGNLGVLIEESNGRLTYHFDPLNPEAQLTYLKLTGILPGSGTRIESGEAVVEPLTVRGTRYIDFLIPGLIAMGIMMSCLWGISYGIIEKRTKKLLRRMVATPMKKSHFLIAKITVRMTLNFVESALLFVFAWIVFDISIQGSIAALMLIFVAGNVAFAGIAIFTSSRTANTEIGNGLINAVVLPMMVLSGIFFSYHNFPDWSIPIIRLFPLTLLADATRSVFIEGAGISETIMPVIVLSAAGVLFFAVGLRMFRWH